MAPEQATGRAFDVSIIAPGGIIYQGKAESVVFPGKTGTFEVMINHKPLLSRLKKGKILVDGKVLKISQGVVRVGLNKVLAIVER